MSGRTQKQRAARERAANIRAEQARRERHRRLVMAGGVVVLVLVLIGGLVAAKLAGLGSPDHSRPPGQASPALLSALQGVPASTYDAVGTGTARGGPTQIDAPPLTRNGKPRVLYIGAEYCPFCAAERWAVATALARFGHFSSLRTTHSSSTDVYPNTPTLSFHDVGYTSSYVDLTGVETTSNQQSGSGYKPLDKPTAADEKILETYDQAPYIKGTPGAIPFVDIGGTWVSSGATYEPSLLAGKTHQQVADSLRNPDSAIGKAVLGSANLFTAAICQTTGNKPAAVCTSAGVTKAATRLGSK